MFLLQKIIINLTRGRYVRLIIIAIMSLVNIRQNTYSTLRPIIVKAKTNNNSFRILLKGFSLLLLLSSRSRSGGYYRLCNFKFKK